MLLLDLAVFHRREHEIGMREAIAWSVVWIVTALIFNVIVYFWLGDEAAVKFITAFLVEKSLSVDNLFVFILIFSYFSVPAAYQHKVLFWGIMGALVMRGIFIAAGIVLLHFFHWAIYGFGILLILSAFKIAFSKDRQIEPERNPVLRLFRRIFSITEDYEHEKFFARRAGRLIATPLLVVLVVI
jgi:tellurite resistance protein TerC